jgi:sec-independent protein translocase protein TatB
MFGVDSIELLVVAVLALLFIGPKELPRVMMQIGRWVGKFRGYARHFTSGIENAMREAELEEMERKWREENQRILAQYPADGHYPDPTDDMPPLAPEDGADQPAQPDLPLEPATEPKPKPKRKPRVRDLP